jgi:hypothetical protein
MKDKNHEAELDALKADLARLREEMTGLAAGVKSAAGMQTDQAHAAAPRDHLPGEEGHGVWTDLFRKFDASRVQGEKVVKDLAAEVEQHPLVSVMAAFGLGYIIAKLWYRGKANEDTNDPS